MLCASLDMIFICAPGLEGNGQGHAGVLEWQSCCATDSVACEEDPRATV